MQIIGSNKASLTAAGLLTPPKAKSFAKQVLKTVSTDSGTLDKKVNREAFSAWSKDSLERIHKVYKELGSRAKQQISTETASANYGKPEGVSKPGLKAGATLDLLAPAQKTKKSYIKPPSKTSKEDSVGVFGYDTSAKLLKQEQSGLKIDLYA